LAEHQHLVIIWLLGLRGIVGDPSIPDLSIAVHDEHRAPGPAVQVALPSHEHPVIIANLPIEVGQQRELEVQTLLPCAVNELTIGAYADKLRPCSPELLVHPLELLHLHIAYDAEVSIIEYEHRRAPAQNFGQA